MKKVLLLLLIVAACSGPRPEPVFYDDEDMDGRPGIFSGEKGEFIIGA